MFFQHFNHKLRSILNADRKLVESTELGLLHLCKVLGKILEDVCVSLLEKYQAEQKALSEEIEQLEAKLNAIKQDENDVEEFIFRLKKYTDVQELTREMCLELIEYITVDEYAADRSREIHIYYKLLEKTLPHKKFLEVDNSKETA